MKNLIIVLCLFFVLHLSATIINIPADQPTIQAGINIAVEADTVLVQSGTYVENIDFNGKLITVGSLFLTTQDTTFISSTIIDGNQDDFVVKFHNGEDSSAVLYGFTIINGNSGIYCLNSNPSLENLIISGNSTNYYGGGIHCAENSNPIIKMVTISGNNAYRGGGISCRLGSAPSLENVTILNNNATKGGGIYCEDESNMSLEFVTITGNSASHLGGGIYCDSSSPFLQNVSISDNDGGGVFLFYCTNPNFENVTISANTASAGGGIYSYESNPNLLNVTILNNMGGYNGGGICCTNESNLNLKNVTMTNNSAQEGGGIFSSETNLSLENVVISENTALGDFGGGIYCYASNSNLTNVLISNNTVVNKGGGLCYSHESISNLKNVTITNNNAQNGGGIYCFDNSSLNLVNCIMWNDTPEEIYFSSQWEPNTITISYSDIEGGEAGIVTNNNGSIYWQEGNIEEDPLFIGTGEHPYSFLEDSPCIDVGIPDTTGLNLPPWDIIGNHRIWDGDENGSAIIDMGAYEYGAPAYVDIDDNVIIQTSEVSLHQNFPNPFNPTTTISFSLQKNSKVELSIYNIKGQKIKSLLSNQTAVGEHSIVWDGKDASGKKVGSGIYLYKLNVNGKIEAVKKCLLLK
ncbi:MAG: right-handed parallel beta-helix repeat-containing protein [Candidatus Cloacimonetes bacterium]|nr:right-handed parallel beta-helix repeat-containing protein [Candidatus Cloacimonadota bacterium]